MATLYTYYSTNDITFYEVFSFLEEWEKIYFVKTKLILH